MNFIFFIVLITEHQSICRAGLNASWHEIPSCHSLVIKFSSFSSFYCDFSSSDSLTAKCAFFCDTTCPYCDIWIELILQSFRPSRLPKVEESHLICAVVYAISCTYTTVIYLNIQSLIVVISRIYRTYWFTRSIPTMLAHNWKISSLHIREITFPVSFYPNPFKSSFLHE